MSTLSGILNTARNSLLFEQLAMQVIGHNTANVTTEGYSRKRLDGATSPAFTRTGQWIIGSGVHISNLGRIRDRLIDEQYRRTNTNLGYWSQYEDSLGQVEEIFNEFGAGAISDQLQDFWDGWQDLANDPESTSARTALKSSAQTLASSLNRAHRNLSLKREELDKEFMFQVGDINRITQEIAELNVRIVDMETATSEASDLRDQRDLLLDQLSEYAPVSVHENEDGAVNIYLNGQILVQVDHAETIGMAAHTSGNVTLHQPLGPGTNAPLELTQGKLAATLAARDEAIPEAMAHLDTFSTTLATEVNSRHVTGYGLTGTNGFDFWDANTTGAADIAVDSAIIFDPNLIATSSSADAPGDNSVALWIGQLQTERIMDGGASTLSEYYTGFITNIGTQTAAASERRSTEESTINLLTERRQSVSGVSMDEEMANLIRVQKSYEAAAKVVTTVDEMMQTVIAM